MDAPRGEEDRRRRRRRLLFVACLLLPFAALAAVLLRPEGETEPDLPWVLWKLEGPTPRAPGGRSVLPALRFATSPDGPAAPVTPSILGVSRTEPWTLSHEVLSAPPQESGLFVKLLRRITRQPDFIRPTGSWVDVDVVEMRPSGAWRAFVWRWIPKGKRLASADTALAGEWDYDDGSGSTRRVALRAEGTVSWHGDPPRPDASWRARGRAFQMLVPEPPGHIPVVPNALVAGLVSDDGATITGRWDFGAAYGKSVRLVRAR